MPASMLGKIATGYLTKEKDNLRTALNDENIFDKRAKKLACQNNNNNRPKNSKNISNCFCNLDELFLQDNIGVIDTLTLRGNEHFFRSSCPITESTDFYWPLGRALKI